jgi:glycogen phosphorylase
VPAYYERDGDGLPQGWLKVMRRAMASGLWRFSTTRMLHEYTERLYLPAAGVDVAAPAADEAGGAGGAADEAAGEEAGEVEVPQ